MSIGKLVDIVSQGLHIVYDFVATSSIIHGGRELLRSPGVIWFYLSPCTYISFCLISTINT